MLLIRVFAGSMIEYRRGQAFFEKGELRSAEINFNRAIRWYLPLNPFVGKSIKKLLKIGETFEKSGKNEDALHVYEKLRSSIYSTRSFFTPNKTTIDVLETKIASLRSIEVKGLIKENILKGLKIDRSPSLLFSIMSIIGFLGWISAALIFIIWVIGKEKRSKKEALIVGMSFFIFYFLWLFGLAGA